MIEEKDHFEISGKILYHKNKVIEIKQVRKKIKFILEQIY